MRKKPSVLKSFFGTITVMVILYLSVYTLSDNEEIVKTDVIKLPVEIEEVVGLEVISKEDMVDVEVKGTKEMLKNLKDIQPYVQVNLEEKDIGNTEESIGEENTNLDEKYSKNVTVVGLDEYIYKILTDIELNIKEIEGEKVTLKIKVKGSTENKVKDIELLEEVYSYFTEEEKSIVDTISLYIDLNNLDENNEVVGEIKIEDAVGEDLGLVDRLNTDKVRVRVVYENGVDE